MLRHFLQNILNNPLLAKNALHPLNFSRSSLLQTLGSIKTGNNLFNLRDQTCRNLNVLVQSMTKAEVRYCLEHPAKKTMMDKIKRKKDVHHPLAKKLFLPDKLTTEFEVDPVPVLTYSGHEQEAKIYCAEATADRALKKAIAKKEIIPAAVEATKKESWGSWLVSTAQKTLNKISELSSSAIDKAKEYYHYHTSSDFLEDFNQTTVSIISLNQDLDLDDYIMNLDPLSEDSCSSQRSFQHIVRGTTALNILMQKMGPLALLKTRITSPGTLTSLVTIIKREFTHAFMLSATEGNSRENQQIIEKAIKADLTLDKDFLDAGKESLSNLFTDFDLDKFSKLDFQNHQTELKLLIKSLFPVTDKYSYARLIAIKKLISTLRKDNKLPLLESESLQLAGGIITKLIGKAKSILGLSNAVDTVKQNLLYLEEAMDQTLFASKKFYIKDDSDAEAINKLSTRAFGKDGHSVRELMHDIPDSAEEFQTKLEKIIKKQKRDSFNSEKISARVRVETSGYLLVSSVEDLQRATSAYTHTTLNEFSRNGDPSREEILTFKKINREYLNSIEGKPLLDQVNHYLMNMNILHLAKRKDLKGYINSLIKIQNNNMKRISSGEMTFAMYHEFGESDYFPLKEVFDKYFELLQIPSAINDEFKSELDHTHVLIDQYESQITQLKRKKELWFGETLDEIIQEQNKLIEQLANGEITLYEFRKYQEVHEWPTLKTIEEIASKNITSPKLEAIISKFKQSNICLDILNQHDETNEGEIALQQKCNVIKMLNEKDPIEFFNHKLQRQQKLRKFLTEEATITFQQYLELCEQQNLPPPSNVNLYQQLYLKIYGENPELEEFTAQYQQTFLEIYEKSSHGGSHLVFSLSCETDLELVSKHIDEVNKQIQDIEKDFKNGAIKRSEYINKLNQMLLPSTQTIRNYIRTHEDSLMENPVLHNSIQDFHDKLYGLELIKSYGNDPTLLTKRINLFAHALKNMKSDSEKSLDISKFPNVNAMEVLKDYAKILISNSNKTTVRNCKLLLKSLDSYEKQYNSIVKSFKKPQSERSWKDRFSKSKHAPAPAAGKELTASTKQKSVAAEMRDKFKSQKGTKAILPHKKETLLSPKKPGS